MPLFLGFLCLFSFVGSISAKDAVVVFVVDPAWDCVASYVANVPRLQEYSIVKVMIRRGESLSCNSDYADIYKTITYNSSTPNDALAAEEICPKLQDMGVPVAAVISTWDPAVTLTDRLAACVGVRGNSVATSKVRHDKWAMTEAVRKAGLRSVKEKLVTTWQEARKYLESLDTPLSNAHPVIFKILEGSSSEGVHKVYDMKQAEEIFNGADMFGPILIQEFLKGKEYVIDSASRDGVHKALVVYYEDLRPGNGEFVLYYGFKAMNPEDQKIAIIIDYVNKVLDATGVQNGASDVEVIWLEDEGRPCINDVNARWSALMWHDGLALEKAIAGNEQITATVNAYLDGDAFDALPPAPIFKQYGAMVFGNIWHAGILEGMPGLALAKTLPSYFGSVNPNGPDLPKKGMMMEKNNGATVHSPLTVVLVNENKDVVDADYDRLLDLMTSDAFFDITPSTRHTSLRALHPGDGGFPGHSIPAIAASAMLVVAMVLAVGAISRQNVRDGTEYLTIE